MIKATQRPRKNRNSRGNVIYDSSFATGRQNYISGAAAPDDFWAERSQEEIHRSNKDVRLAASRAKSCGSILAICWSSAGSSPSAFHATTFLPRTRLRR